MKLNSMHTTPLKSNYDVVIIGGANMGASVASFLALNEDFNGSVLVVEKDMSFQFASTAHSNDCMRQQFANEINIEIAQYGAEYIKNFRDNLGGDAKVPNLAIRNFGYLYLSDNEAFTKVLQRDQQTLAKLGAGTKMVSLRLMLPCSTLTRRKMIFYETQCQPRRLVKSNGEVTV